MISTETRTALPVGTWELDPVHSTIGFEINYMVGAFRGQFREVEAHLDGASEGFKLVGVAKVASVDVKDENLAAHLQTPDFFDAERHPELRFESSDLEASGDRLTVRGDLTIKGVTKPVELHGSVTEVVTDAYGRDRIGLRLETTVDRNEFGVSWNVPLPSGQPALADEVSLAAELYFVREA
ncbi:MAG TPA: YceI family protein [Gaiellaceae bacterium]